MKTFYKVVKKTFDAIQYDGKNICEIFQFIDSHNGNANNVSFEKFLVDFKRPKEIPLDKDGTEICNKLFDEWEEKNNEGITAYKNARSMYADEKDFISEEELENRRYIQSMNKDWRKEEEYHIYVNTFNNRCRLLGICKNDWFMVDMNGFIENYTDEQFVSYLEENGWKEE